VTAIDEAVVMRLGAPWQVMQYERDQTIPNGDGYRP
jgi:hypothetical protein